MLIEANAVAPGTRIRADICVIGTGPAGLTLLNELSGEGLRVVGLESGHQTFIPETNRLCEGTVVSADYPPGSLSSSRRRQLGGTAHLWNDELDAGRGNELVRLVELDPIDFTKRSWVPFSGWPFEKSEVQKFYDQAFDLVEATSSLNQKTRPTSKHPELLSTKRLSTVLSRFAARTVFTRDLPQKLATHPGTSIYLGATLLELVEKDSRIDYARVASTPERQFEIAAKVFILAGGGIENARLLLLSNRTQHNGIGNQHDLVGRFFMDHPSFRLGALTPSSRNLFRSAALYDHHLADGYPVMGKLTFRDQTMRERQMLNICVTLTPRGRDYESDAVKILQRALKSGSTVDGARLLAGNLQTITNNPDELAAKIYHKLSGTKLVYFENKGGWSRLSKPERRFHKFELACLAEQAPNPDNRILLTEARDCFGQRKSELHWKWSDVDIRSIQAAQEILREEFETSQLGTFATQLELDESDRPAVATPHHHIGTTRMHVDSRYGVVDPDCRVHGVSNLYIAGSSVFPTGGFANPTLTIVALALRLSYHLRELMKPGISSLNNTVGAPVARSGA